MNRPSMYETVADAPETKEELTLETLNRRVETLAENLNRIYEVFEKSVTDKFMQEAQMTQHRDQAVSEGFYNIGLSITGLNAKVETLADFLSKHETVELDPQWYKTTALNRAQEAIKVQEAEIQKLVEAQQAKMQAQATR